MDEMFRYRGKDYTQREIDGIKDIIAAYWDRGRSFISREICRRWDWTQPNGVPKDMICRGLLLSLQSHGLIELPPKLKNSPNPLLPRRRPPVIEVDQAPVIGSLSDIRPVELVQVRRTPLETLYKSLIEQYHYLGYTRPVGEHLEYIAFSYGRPIACLGWCSPPRHIGCRDRYIGWNQEHRVKRLHFVVINTRFLILPWVEISHLASHLLGMMVRRISSDWESTYAHEVVFLESFVDPERGFRGTCYKAANWVCLGRTTGRGKNDSTKKANRSLKLVFGYPLKKDFREVLCGLL